eukprot:7600023-Pyramimonas_sp.AAC.1
MPEDSRRAGVRSQRNSTVAGGALTPAIIKSVGHAKSNVYTLSHPRTCRILSQRISGRLCALGHRHFCGSSAPRRLILTPKITLITLVSSKQSGQFDLEAVTVLSYTGRGSSLCPCESNHPQLLIVCLGLSVLQHPAFFGSSSLLSC